MGEVTREEIERRVKGYLKRMDRDSLLEKYPLNDKGVYVILSGAKGDYRERTAIGIVEGRFIDIIAYASQQPEFLGDWCNWALPDNCNYGKIEKIKIKQIKPAKSLNFILEEGIK